MDLVVNEPEPEGPTPEADPDDAPEPEDDGEDEAWRPEAERQEQPSPGGNDADADVLEDDEAELQNMGKKKAAKVASDRWGCSVVNSYQMLTLGEHTN